MTSLSNAVFKGFPNVPAPAGSKGASTYSRIIPAEELGTCNPWQPGTFGGVSGIGGEVERRAKARAEEPVQPSADEWRARIADARKAGYQDGYRDGLVGLDNFKQSHAAQVATQIGQLVQSFDQQWTQLEPRMAEALARSAVALARGVLRREVQAHPQQVSLLASEAVQAVMLSARRLEVHVHPDDVESVALGAGELLKSRGARVVADAQVQRGGCLVHSDIGSVDARLATRWAQASAALGSTLAWDDSALETATPQATPGAA